MVKRLMPPVLAIVIALAALMIPASASAATATAPASALPATLASSTANVTQQSQPVVVTSVGPQALSDCPSGWFCFWTSTSFVGSRIQFSSNGWHDLHGFAGPFRSLYNHRSKSAFVHQSSKSTPEFCVEPGESISNMNLAYNHAEWLYLAANQDFC